MRGRLSSVERRGALLDAALGLFASRGYDSTAIGEVAEAAGVTKPVLYDHFSSKQELYVQLLHREAGKMLEATSADLDPEAPLEVRLRTVALTAIAFARNNIDSARLLLQQPVGDIEVSTAHEAVREAARDRIADTILADPAFEASAGLSREASARLIGDLHSAVLGRLVRWAIEHPRNSARALSQVFVAVLWEGLRGTP